MALYEKFGEFNSWEEINMAVANQLKEGNEESKQAIFEIAEENGIDKEEAQDFIDGIVPELCNPFMAAEGKIRVEMKEYGINDDAQADYDWCDALVLLCREHEEIALAVRKKNKSLAEAIGQILAWSGKHRKKTHSAIVDAASKAGAGFPRGAKVEHGEPSKATAVKILKKYYLEG